MQHREALQVGGHDWLQPLPATAHDMRGVKACPRPSLLMAAAAVLAVGSLLSNFEVTSEGLPCLLFALRLT